VPQAEAQRRWVALDVGETLIDETRFWAAWADLLAIPRLTFFAVCGAVIARGGQHWDVFAAFGRPDWRDLAPEHERRCGPFVQADLYPDALPTLKALAEAGYRVAVVANQPARRTAELRALGVAPDVMAMSDEMGVHKPAAEFFARALELMGDPDPADVAHVGDRLDNDVRPSARAGMRPVWLRRGPWGLIADEAPPPGTLEVRTLDELVARAADIWR
jgi:HAD superfamily hydrolase (TIGR01549 family)